MSMSIDEPVAGPSSVPEPTAAPSHTLPFRPFYSVEFPGYVQQTSVPRAVAHLGGQTALNRVFNPNASKLDMLLELNWRPEMPFSHSAPTNVIVSQGILLKVVKKRRKKREDDVGESAGEFIAEAVGIIPRTARFRSMSDFQYMPNISDPVADLRMAMDRMDSDVITNYRIPPEKEDYALSVDNAPDTTLEAQERSNLRLIPPPVFSRSNVPHIYNYKQNPFSIVDTVVDEGNGTEKKRFINKHRWKPIGPATVSYADKEVPKDAPPNIRESEDRVKKPILERLRQHFEERPIWTRSALYSHFSPADSREITNSKALLGLTSYTFSDGPWRDTYIKFGYDPRTNPESRFFQRLYFRNINHPVTRAPILARRQENRDAVGQRRFEANAAVQEESCSGVPMAHVFDGVHLNRETAAYQLCDITDPMLKEMIEDEKGVRDECNERDGWYTMHAIERIKTVLRHKFFSLVEGHDATDEECMALLEATADSTERRPYRDTTRKHRAGKHNMAKGVMRPEDAAALRLRAKLDSNARNNSKVT